MLAPSHPALLTSPNGRVTRSMLASSPPVMMALDSFKEEHLVWGPQFGARFAGSLLLCGVLLLGAQNHPPSHASLQRVLLRMSSSLSSAPAWTTLGLLSSSCCAAQLVLNAFSRRLRRLQHAARPVAPARAGGDLHAPAVRAARHARQPQCPPGGAAGDRPHRCSRVAA